FDPYGAVDTPGWDITGILAGFTGHEHDPDLGLVNMKGRLYDGALGRFISADPFVQYPLWSQGLNRYSYGFNNPMSGSDPTGYSWDGWGVVAVVGGGLGLIAYGVCVAEAACGTVDWGATSSSSSGADAGGASPVGDVVGGGYAMYDAISGLYESSYTSYP